MKKTLHLFILFLAGLSTLYAQSSWTLTSQTLQGSAIEFELDENKLFKLLNTTHITEWIDLPLPDQTIIKIKLTRVSNFNSALAAKYPFIHSFYGVHQDTRVRIDINPNSFHAILFQNKNTYLLDPVENSENKYRIRALSDIQNPKKNDSYYSCQTQDLPQDPDKLNIPELRAAPESNVALRKYRLALAVTGEFSRTLGNTREKIMEGLNTHVNRINAVFIRDHAISFELVANNDSLIFTDGNTDPYSNGSVDQMLGQNVATLNQRIGLNNYDIGHVFGTNAGGVATLNSACTALKGSGVSSSFGLYTGSQFFLIPCHEIGHQFSATHSFNFCDNQNETSRSAYEPGSGSTIMSYAGASDCGPNYVQSISDPYFHAYSMEQIKTYSRIGTGNLCASINETNNQDPISTISISQDLVLPILTPFELSGSGMDNFKDQLSFTWEELDLGLPRTLGSPSGSSPLFRSTPPSIDSFRIFPNINTILNNSLDINEVLPSNSRPLNFRFTVRDNDSEAGGHSWTDFSMRSIQTAGPFKISSFNNRDTLPMGSLQLITWDVNKTNLGPIFCNQVDIYLSENAGKSFTSPIVLNTDNDGSEWIKIPNKNITAARFKIKASRSVFFDINDADIVISNKLPAQIQTAVFPNQISLCAGSNFKFKIISSNAISKSTLQLKTISQLPSYAHLIFSRDTLNALDSTEVIITIDSDAPFTLTKIVIAGISSTVDTSFLSIGIQIIAASLPLVFPAHGADLISLNPLFKWSGFQTIFPYRLEISSDPLFNNIVYQHTIQADSASLSNFSLESNKLYYWRVISAVNCLIDHSVPFALFHTQSSVCKNYKSTDTPIFISATGTPTIQSAITVPESFKIDQIIIPNMNGSHEFVGDLEFNLIHPDGKSIRLINRQCANRTNFNLGLDDLAGLDIICPLTDIKLHKPVESLSGFNQKDAAGKWILQIKDLNSGNGGSLDEWILSLCTNNAFSGPVLKNNKLIEIQEFRSGFISNDVLSFTDLDSEAKDLHYTILSNPKFGYLLSNGKDSIKLGSSFTQADLQSNRISFSAQSVKQDTTMVLEFIVRDEKNNWSGLYLFKIRILNDPSIPLKDNRPTSAIIKAYPIPFKSELTLENLGNHSMPYTIYSVSGGMYASGILGAAEKKNITLSSLLPGLYFLKYTNQYCAGTLKLISTGHY